jgi:hypothetical protein
VELLSRPVHLGRLGGRIRPPTTSSEVSGALLAGRGSELAELRAVQPPDEKSLWDSHPPLAKVDGRPRDVLILDNGLILIPCPKSADGGKRRLAELANSAPVEQLASKHTFLPYEEVAAVRVTKRVPVKLHVTLQRPLADDAGDVERREPDQSLP